MKCSILLSRVKDWAGCGQSHMKRSLVPKRAEVPPNFIYSTKSWSSSWALNGTLFGVGQSHQPPILLGLAAKITLWRPLLSDPPWVPWGLIDGDEFHNLSCLIEIITLASMGLIQLQEVTCSISSSVGSSHWLKHHLLSLNPQLQWSLVTVSHYRKLFLGNHFEKSYLRTFLMKENSHVIIEMLAYGFNQFLPRKVLIAVSCVTKQLI